MAEPDPQYIAARNAALAATPGSSAQLAAIQTAHQRYLALNRGGVVGGSPYPSPLDPAFELADAIRRLAEAIRPSASGQVISTTSVAVNTWIDIPITFPAGRFTGNPTIVANCSSSRFIVGALAVSTTGATLRVANWSDAASQIGTLHWLAMSPGG